MRGEYGFSAFGGEMQWAAEGAFNFLDLATDLGERQPDGTVNVLSGLRPGERILGDPPPGVAAGWSSGTTGPGR